MRGFIRFGEDVPMSVKSTKVLGYVWPAKGFIEICTDELNQISKQYLLFFVTARKSS